MVATRGGTLAVGSAKPPGARLSLRDGGVRVKCRFITFAFWSGPTPYDTNREGSSMGTQKEQLALIHIRGAPFVQEGILHFGELLPHNLPGGLVNPGWTLPFGEISRVQ